jgi:hypothetical protein
MLRDFVDHDLDEALTREVEDHVHVCRTCGLALARVECEAYRLRSGFLGSWAVVGPRPGFSKRVVGRLLAETETDRRLPADTTGMAGMTAGVGGAVPDDPELATALRIAAAGAARARAAVAARSAVASVRTPRERRSMMFAAVSGALLIAIAVGMVWGGTASLSAVVHFSLVSGHNVWLDAGADRHRLSGGDGIGEGAVLVVDPGGSAELHLHDASLTGQQPAADIKIGGDSELGLQDGYPLLSRGSIEVQSKRDMLLMLADGSRVALGEGEYHISVTEQSSVFDALAAAAPQLSVRVEVLDGDAAHVGRNGGGPVQVAVGQVGQYGSGFSGVSVATLPLRGGLLTARAPLARDGSPTEEVPDLTGIVVDDRNNPLPRCQVTLNYNAAGQGPVEGLQVLTDMNGRYAVQTVGVIPDGTVVVAVQPPSGSSLGFRVPDALRISGDPGSYTLPRITLAAGQQVTGQTTDASGVPLGGVRVVPCLYDEVLGLVKPWVGRAQPSDAAGMFTIGGLPATLPQHQMLGVIAFHGDYDVAFQAMPGAGSAYAALGPLRVVMQQQRRITVRGLSQWQNQQAYVCEELLALPSPGMGMRFRGVGFVQGDTIEGLQVGLGRLWLRVGPGSLLRPLVAGAGGTFEVGNVVPFDTVFGTPVADMDELASAPNQTLKLAARQRHDGYHWSSTQSKFCVQNPGAPAETAIEGAQVFALAPQPFGGFRARFLCAQAADGAPFDFQWGEREVVAIDGNRVCWRDVAAITVNQTIMPNTGGVEFALALVPQQGMQLTIRPLDEGTAGPRPPLYRFITPGEAFVDGLPPGRYTILDSLGVSRPVTVASDQRARIQ